MAKVIDGKRKTYNVIYEDIRDGCSTVASLSGWMSTRNSSKGQRMLKEGKAKEGRASAA